MLNHSAFSSGQLSLSKGWCAFLASWVILFNYFLCDRFSPFSDLHTSDVFKYLFFPSYFASSFWSSKHFELVIFLIIALKLFLPTCPDHRNFYAFINLTLSSLSIKFQVLWFLSILILHRDFFSVLFIFIGEICI